MSRGSLNSGWAVSTVAPSPRRSPPPVPPRRPPLGRRRSDRGRGCRPPGARPRNRRRPPGSRTRRAPARPVARIGLGQHLEHERQVLDGAGHRPGMGQGAVGTRGPHRHAAVRGFEPGMATEGGGDPDRAATVGAGRQRGHAEDEGRRLPPLDPPAVREGSHGFRVTPWRGESVTPFHPSSGVVVLPINTAPLRRSEATAGASTSHG